MHGIMVLVGCNGCLFPARSSLVRKQREFRLRFFNRIYDDGASNAAHRKHWSSGFRVFAKRVPKDVFLARAAVAESVSRHCDGVVDERIVILRFSDDSSGEDTLAVARSLPERGSPRQLGASCRERLKGAHIVCYLRHENEGIGDRRGGEKP